MSKFQSALVFAVALSAAAIVATAAAHFTSPAKAPKKADRRNSKRKLSNRKTRAPPEESQALRPAEPAEIIYLPRPVFLRSDHITSFNKIPISEIPIYIPLPIFQNTQGFALSQTGANETSDYVTNARVSGPAAGAKQQPYQDTLSELSAIPSCRDSVNILYSLDQHDVAEFSKIHTLLTNCGPSQIRQIPYAAAVITPTTLHNTTANTAPMRTMTPKNDIQAHQNLETVQPQLVCYSLDKHEVSEASKFTDVRFASGPNQVRQIAYGMDSVSAYSTDENLVSDFFYAAFLDVQRKAVPTETVVTTEAAAPKSAPHEERFGLSRHESETTRPIVSGPFGIRQIPFVAENSIVVPATKTAKPVSVPSTLDSSTTHQLKSEAEPLYSLDWNETQNAWKYVLSSAAPSKEHSATVGTAVKEAAVPAAAPHQAVGVTSTLFSLDEHEMQNVWKIAPIYSMAMLLPENIPSSPVLVPAIKSQPISSIVPVKSTNVPLFALSSSDFEISPIYINDMLANGPLGIRQIPYASESVPSKTAIQAPVATCNSSAVEKTAETKKDEKKYEKKEAKKEEKIEEKKEEKKEEKCVAKIEKAEAKPVAKTSSGPVKATAVVEQPLSSTDNVVASKTVAAKLVFIPVSPDLSAGSSSPVFLGGDPAEVFNPYANPLTNSRSNRSHGMHSPPESRLNPNAAVWEPSSFASGNENGMTMKGLNPFAPTFQLGAFDDGYGSVNDLPQYPNVTRTTSGGGNGAMSQAGGRTGNNGTKNNNKAKGKGKRISKDVAALPTGPTLADYFKVDKKKGSVSVIEKVAVPTVDAIVPKKRGSSPTILSAEKSSRVSLQVLPQLY
ncbi:hypothetical protein HDU78_004176 [Chytriomyces hyalinus]|nr:hypothetical protein HDU78_004176 [Chytriomyces hyalinus]